MAILSGPLISLETESEIEQELEAQNNGRWQRLRVEIMDEGETILIVFLVSDEQGDDDENVEEILQLAERTMTAKIPEKVPILSDDLSWSAGINYDTTGDDRYVRGNFITSTGGGWETRFPQGRERHGSEEDLGDESLQQAGSSMSARWLARRAARKSNVGDK